MSESVPDARRVFGPWEDLEAERRIRREAELATTDVHVIFEPAASRERWVAAMIDLAFAFVLTLGTQWLLFLFLYGAFENTPAAMPYVYVQNVFALSMLVIYPWLAMTRGGGWGKRAFGLMSVDEATGAIPRCGTALVATLFSMRVTVRAISFLSPFARGALAEAASSRVVVVHRSCSIDRYHRGAWRTDPRSPVPLEHERRAVLAPRSIAGRVIPGGGVGGWIARAMVLVVAIYAAGWLFYNLAWLITR